MQTSFRRLRTAFLLAASAGAVLFVAEWTSLAHRIYSWPAQKIAGRAALDEIVSRFRGRLDPAEQAYFAEDVNRIWKTCLEVERRHAANLAAMNAAIGAKVAAGELDEATAVALLEKAEGLHAARMYYLYGAFLKQGARELLSDESVPDEALADKLTDEITREQLEDVARRFEFRPRDYGLPSLPDVVVDGDRLVPSSRPRR